MSRVEANLTALLAHLGVSTYQQRHPLPTLDDIARSSHGPQVRAVYEQLGGRLNRLPMNLRTWDIELEQEVLEIDKEQHFNRYRLITLNSPLYKYIPNFPLHSYRVYCRSA